MNILELFNIPNKYQTDRRIYVKDILSRLELSTRDKQTFEKTIGAIKTQQEFMKHKVLKKIEEAKFR